MNPAALVDAVEVFIDANALARPGSTILTGVSGGVDSMVLLNVLQELHYEVEVAHVNYGLRASDSDSDERLVRTYCEERNLRCHVLDAGPSMRHRPGGTSVQAFARKIRYDFFREIADARASSSITAVAVAHHAGDQIETIILNLDRKTGLDGLAGMRPKRPLYENSDLPLIRPLLGAQKSAIIQFAETHRIPWNEDISNRSESYARTEVRYDRVPAIEKCYGPGSIDDILDLSAAIRHFLDSRLPALLPEALQYESTDRPDGGGLVPITALTSLDSSIRGWYLLRCLRRWLPGVPVRRSVVEGIEALLECQTGRKQCFGNDEIWRERDHLRFRPESATIGDAGIATRFVAVGEVCSISTGNVMSEMITSRPNSFTTDGKDTIYLDADAIVGDLRIRPWMDGDRMDPFGTGGSSKVKTILTDGRARSSGRKHACVLEDDEQILWVIGYRASRHASIGNTTERIIRFSLEPSKEVES